MRQAVTLYGSNLSLSGVLTDEHDGAKGEIVLVLDALKAGQIPAAAVLEVPSDVDDATLKRLRTGGFNALEQLPF